MKAVFTKKMLIWSDSRNCSTEFEQKNQSTQHERGDYTVSLAQQNYQLTDRNVHFQTAQHILVFLRRIKNSISKSTYIYYYMGGGVLTVLKYVYCK